MKRLTVILAETFVNTGSVLIIRIITDYSSSLFSFYTLISFPLPSSMHVEGRDVR